MKVPAPDATDGGPSREAQETLLHRGPAGGDALDFPRTPSWRRFIPAWLRGLFWVDDRSHYDAFLSYAWSTDGEVAPALQSLFQGFLRPWYKIRAKNVFRDLSCLPAGSSLHVELFARLDQSDHLIVLACPAAAKSGGMELEASYWFSRPRAGHVLIVVTSGDGRTWEDIRCRLLPPSLAANLLEEPLFVLLQDRRQRILTDPGGVREELIEDLKQVLLRLHPGRTWGELRGEERRHRRNALTLLTVVTAALLALTAWARVAQVRAEHAALRTQLELNALAIRDRLDTGGQAEALDDATNDVAVAVHNLGDVPFTTANSLRNAVERSRESGRWPSPGQVDGIAVTRGGSEIVVVTRNGDVSRWDWRGTHVSQWQASAEQFQARLTPGGQGVFVRHEESEASTRGTATLLRLDGSSVWSSDIETVADASGDVSEDGATFAIAADGTSLVIQRGASRAISTVGPRRASAGDAVAITHIQLSGDGERLLLAYEDGLVQILETRRATPVTQWRAVSGSLVFTDPGFTHIAELKDQQVTVRHAPQFEPVQLASTSFPSQNAAPSAIEAISIAGNGRMAVTFQNDERIEVAEPDGSSRGLALRGGRSPRVAWSIDGTQLAAGDYNDGTVRVFDVTASTARYVAPPRSWRATTAIAYCERDDAIVLGDIEGGIRAIWPASGRTHEHGRVHDYVENIACLADGSLVSVGRLHGLLFHPHLDSTQSVPLAMNVTNSEEPAGGDGSDDPSFAVAAIESGQAVVASTYRGQLTRWQPRVSTRPTSRFDLVSLTGGRVQEIRALASFPATSDVVVAGVGREGSYVARIALEGRGTVRWFKYVPSVDVIMSLTVEEQSRNILVAGAFDRLVVLDESGMQILDLVGIQRPMIFRAAPLGPDWFAASSLWGGLSLWRTTGEKLPPNFASWIGRGPVQLAFSRRYQRLYAADGDGSVVEITLGVPDLVTTACQRLAARLAVNGSRDGAGARACREGLATALSSR